MKPGKRLDCEIHYKVFGIYPRGFTEIKNVPNYSTSINEAWALIEKFLWAEPEIKWSDEQHCYFVTFWKGFQSGHVSSGETAEHAICLAALKAVTK